MILLGESFASEDVGRRACPGARFQECHAMGYIKNVNTKEVRRSTLGIPIL